MLKLTEIFFSLQGETSRVGLPTIFIRLTGCPLRCQYCDTAYAFSGGKNYSIDEILKQISQYKTKYVTVTGGEPLAQKACLHLLKKLCDKNYSVSLETSGAVDIAGVDSRVVKILDIKTPASNEASRNIFDNLKYIFPSDEIKFVICNREDYDWSKKIISEYNLLERCAILFSPSYLQIANETLAHWILEDNLPVRFQIQLHKMIWGDARSR
ncbi:MAG: 7-carboxy-7-deazaguanine synthase QueE [Gammaproteobacteria bacterium RIFCSPHIGHO2_12_FULL_38_11]|nr:MAG: 7-carboxy-7-deazaguanine synthase QueE [Gammaproteobacteria bacterium RIFCSPHIGHO2_12_FULL_38_11]